MRPITLKQIANYLGEISSNDQLVYKVIIDSRQAQQNSLFFALEGENVDGHQYVTDVLDMDGFAVVKRGFGSGERIIEVDDPILALQQLARCYLEQFDIPVIGVTGSNGKTTTKDLIAGVLSTHWRVHKTEGNFNNELGLPLTVLSLEPFHQAIVLEMGMRGLGQIRQLTSIAPLDVAVITNIGPVHMELLGSLERIAQAKGEILGGLKPNGLAVLNGDDPLIQKQMSGVSIPVLYYGKGVNNELRPIKERIGEDGHVQYTCLWRGQHTEVVLPIPGLHNVYNSLAAIGIGLTYGLTLAQCAEQLKNVSVSKMRMEIVNGRDGIRLINDAYNASPVSMRAALETIAVMECANRRVAILGDMLELGEISVQAHQEMGAYAAARFDQLIFVGRHSKDFLQGASALGVSSADIGVYLTVEELIINIDRHVQPEDLVLVKASRAVALERVVEALER